MVKIKCSLFAIQVKTRLVYLVLLNRKDNEIDI